MNEQEAKQEARSLNGSYKAIAKALIAAYAAGVKAATPPPGHIIDDAGNVRKVLGTLPLTADGCVIGQGEVPVWINNGSGPVRTWTLSNDPRMYGRPLHADCYSTREAAEAARKDGKP